MEYIALALVGFVFTCIALPSLIKHRSQFFLAVWGTIAIILIATIGEIAPGSKFQQVMIVIEGFLDLFTFIALIMATGGLSLRELGGELSNAYEVMRRGEEEKTVIIPLTGERAKQRSAAAASAAAPQEQTRIELNDEPAAAAKPAARKEPPRDSGSIPLE